MKILFVVPNVPSYIRPRPFNLIRQLSRWHDVSVLCVATNESDYRFISELQSCCNSVEVFRVPRWQSAWNCLVALFAGVSLRCAYFYSPSLRHRVKASITDKSADLVHAEHLKSIPMVRDAIGKLPMVFDAVDCVSMFEARRNHLLHNPFLRLFSKIEEKRMGRAENRAAEIFDQIVISSPVDRDHYPASGHSQEKLSVVANGVDLEYFQCQPHEPERNQLVFCAKLDYFPNEDAALYFAGSVWPLLRKRRPELHFSIVGSRPSERVLRLDGKENIRVIGFVPDVRPHLGRAWIALCPVRAQAGTQLKILEAMALGVPVIATRICCPGLGLNPGKHLLVADTPTEFVSAMESLLENDALRDNLIREGHMFVERHYDWAQSVKLLCDVYGAAVKEFAVRNGRNLSSPLLTQGT